jgi:hypothetical protein
MAFSWKSSVDVATLKRAFRAPPACTRGPLVTSPSQLSHSEAGEEPSTPTESNHIRIPPDSTLLASLSEPKRAKNRVYGL